MRLAFYLCIIYVLVISFAHAADYNPNPTNDPSQTQDLVKAKEFLATVRAEIEESLQQVRQEEEERERRTEG